MKPADYIGEYFDTVTLVTCIDAGKSRPRVKPVDLFSEPVRVEFPRKLREKFPIGTRYVATVKVCQNHRADGKPHGKPYLRATDIRLIPDSVPEEGLIARVKNGRVGSLAYEYDWKEGTRSQLRQAT